MSNAPAQALLRFIDRSPSRFHVVENFRAMLKEAGFTELFEHEPFQLVPGGKYFLTRAEASILAFRVPEGEIAGFLMAAAHSDSPTFALKSNAEKAGAHYVQLLTERYGGMLMSSWFDRPLSVAGRAIVRTATGVQSRLVDLDQDLLVIPNVAIHMNRAANDGMKYQANVDTYPLLGAQAAKGQLGALIAEAAGCKEEDILATDLYLYVRQAGVQTGLDGQYLLSSRLDDLECAWSAITAMLDAEPSHSIPMACVFDNEEVGSATMHGAASTFLRDTLRRISRALGCDDEQHQMLLSQSFLISADNAHAQHPNHPEYADAANCPYMNEGIVIKYNASRRYATDAVSAAIFRTICARAEVPVQVFANRSDLMGGGTLGAIAGTQVPVPTVDIGLAQLAMHSAVETAGTLDVAYLVSALKEYFGSTLRREGTGEYRI